MSQPDSIQDRLYLVVVKQLRSSALGVGVQHFQQLASQLERGRFKVDPSRGVAEHEAEVDVDDVALLIQHDVAVVPVLDLQEVADQAVTCHALCEVSLSFQTLCCALQMADCIELGNSQVKMCMWNRYILDAVKRFP